MNKQRYPLLGFSLIEMMIALAIGGILAAIAVPAYTDYMVHARRADGKQALLDLAARMERYYSENNTYATATLANVGTGASSPKGYYTLSISAQSASAYTVQAAPAGAQASDTDCGSLTYNQAGQQNVTGTHSVADCWN